MFLIKVHFEFSISLFFLRKMKKVHSVWSFILAQPAMRLFKSSLLATLF